MVWSIARNCAALLAQPSDSAEYFPHYGRSVSVRGERKLQREKSCRCENCTPSQQVRPVQWEVYRSSVFFLKLVLFPPVTYFLIYYCPSTAWLYLQFDYFVWERCLCMSSWRIYPDAEIMYIASMVGEWHYVAMILAGEYRSARIKRIKTCPLATVSTTSPARTGLQLNPGFRGEKPVTTVCLDCLLWT